MFERLANHLIECALNRICITLSLSNLKLKVLAFEGELIEEVMPPHESSESV